MGSAPQPPNPYQVAQAQGAANIKSAIANSELNNVNQITPYGTLNYSQTGMNNGIPQFTATTALSPQMQDLFNSNISNSQAESGLQGQLEKNAASTIAKPLDLSPGAITSNLVNLGNKELQPQFQQQEAQLDQHLANQGLTPGSAGWGYQKSQFGLNRAQAENDLILQGQNTAMQQLMAQYNSPINALTALQSGSQVSPPGIGTLAPTTNSPISPAPISQNVYGSANLANQQYNAMINGLFGLGGSLIKGGTAFIP